MPDSKWKKELVNFTQSPQERQEKYWLVRSLGKDYHTAQRMRDWRLSKIERAFSLNETYNPHSHNYDRDFSKPVLLPDGSIK